MSEENDNKLEEFSNKLPSFLRPTERMYRIEEYKAALLKKSELESELIKIKDYILELENKTN